MVMVRERRHQEALKLPLPPPTPAPEPWHRVPFPLPLVSTRPDSPSIESLSDLEKLAVLGHGSSGTVYKVRHRWSSRIYALKVVRFELDSVGIRQQAAREADILKQVDSQFVVRCYGAFDSSTDSENSDLCFLMEYMEGGSLHDVLRIHQRLPEKVISGVARRVLEGLMYSIA